MNESYMNICSPCWDILKVVPNLIDIPYRTISKISVDCEECGKSTLTPHKIEISNREIERCGALSV
jgi:hypothetical protein